MVETRGLLDALKWPFGLVEYEMNWVKFLEAVEPKLA